MSKFETYLDERIEASTKEEQELIASERKDEANLIKIKNNIYGVCKTIYKAAAKEVYLAKLAHLEQVWSESYEKAKQFNDVEKIVVEETKLQVLAEVIAYYKTEMC